MHTCSWRTIRGYTVVGAVLDEVAVWRSDDSANPDREIVNALRPAMATVPGSLLLAISSPYARKGVLWDAYRRHFGKPGDVLVWQAPTRAMNPGVPQAIIDAALAEDEAAGRAEWLAEFRSDLSAFAGREVVEGATVPGRYELPAVSGVSYRTFVDPSGGSADSMTLALAHFENEAIVLDAVRERRPPFSPERVVADFVELLRAYGVNEVTGDRYAGEWPREQFRKLGVEYVVADKTKSEIYGSFLPILNSGRVALLDSPRLHGQLLGLERRTSRAGRDAIDHGPHGHDDLANSVAGVVTLAATPCATFIGARGLSRERTRYAIGAEPSYEQEMWEEERAERWRW